LPEIPTLGSLWLIQTEPKVRVRWGWPGRGADKKAAGPLAHRPCVVSEIAVLISTFLLNKSSFMGVRGQGGFLRGV
jgi:hypothetical protein